MNSLSGVKSEPTAGYLANPPFWTISIFSSPKWGPPLAKDHRLFRTDRTIRLQWDDNISEYTQRLWLCSVHSERLSWTDTFVREGGGIVTRYPFGPLNVFVYISHWAARVNTQNRPHFEVDYWNRWLTCTLLDAILLAASRRNMIKYLCKIGTWYY